jgi:hypothetical protein
MLPNELFAHECRKRYEEWGLIVDERTIHNGRRAQFAHCPLPKGMGDKGLYLTWEDHQHQGLLQSKDVGRRCFWIADVKRWLDTYPPNYFELYDIYQEYISGVHCHMHGKVGELHPRYGQPGPMLGRTGELHPRYGQPGAMLGRTGELHPRYGQPGAMLGRTGELNPLSRAITAIKPDGTQLHFGGVREAARELGIKPANLSKRYLKTGKSPTKGKFKNWQFFFAEQK